MSVFFLASKILSTIAPSVQNQDLKSSWFKNNKKQSKKSNQSVNPFICGFFFGELSQL